MPVRFRKRLGVRGDGHSKLLLAATYFLWPSFAQAQTLSSPQVDLGAMLDIAPLAIALGALVFGIIATLWVARARQQKAVHQPSAHSQIAEMRANLDEYEALLAVMPGVTLLWTQSGSEARLFGEVAEFGSDRINVTTVQNFRDWISAPDSNRLGNMLTSLRVGGQSFELDLHTLDGGIVRAVGRTLGGTTALRLSVAGDNFQNQAAENKLIPLTSPSELTEMVDTTCARSLLAMFPEPAWIRDENSELIFVNASYQALAGQLGHTVGDGKFVEIFTPFAIAEQQAALSQIVPDEEERTVTIPAPLPDAPQFNLTLQPLQKGSIGYLDARNSFASSPDLYDPAHLNGVIDTLPTPIAIFDVDGDLKQFNTAYCDLWQLDETWLHQGVSERTIIDLLRTQGRLPAVSNYQEWRAAHLSVYELKTAREESWYLPDGRTITVAAVPASGNGGVIYVFEDVTEQLKLQSANKSLANVQRETLNALSEGVAVFGTDGRLRLSNPRLSIIWKVPMNELGQNPHIDQIARECGRVITKDGEQIWAELKLSVISLDPNRIDKSGRIERSDGRLIDYAIVRLPDGQTMLTFVDVTHSANYERVLKERNDALVTADKLKDAFIQNVSYELRSPLTNIIGFADLLASDSFGPLNEQQRAYTDYIRSSSATLGILIDNILDLTHVDAGIAELDLQPLDINALIEKARTGLAATLSGVDGAKPLNLVVTVPKDLPVFVADGGRIVQIFYNLLSNAANFSEPGAKVSLTVEPRGDWMRFIIEDEGVGVPDEVKGSIFQRFEGHTIAGRQRGAGLGLTIVKAFVQLHGGTVSMERREPRGTRVIVSLPTIASQIIAPTERKNAR